MRTFIVILSFILCVSVPQGQQDLAPLPDRNGSLNTRAWESYTRSLLLRLFPTRAKRIREMEIVIAPEANAEAFSYSLGIRISEGLIRMVADEHEYAAAAAHEMVHQLLPHSSAVNVRVDRRWELAADLGSLAVSFKPRSTLSALDRMIPLRVSSLVEAPPEYRLEIAQSLLLRRTSLESLLSEKWTRIGPAKKLPDPMPDKKADIAEWVRYSELLLRNMYPGHPRMGNVAITGTSGDTGPYLLSSATTHAGTTIVMNDRIRSLGLTKEELATLLGHEFGHALLGRNYERAYARTGLTEQAAEVRSREEEQSDLIATLPLEKGECYLSRGLTKILRSPHVKISGDLLAFNRERARVLGSICTWNY
jgi:Zn-dependent protease with chaperone function